MKTFEIIAEVTDENIIHISIPKEFVPGKYKVVLVLEEEPIDDELTDEEKAYFDRQLEEIEKNPNCGFSMKEIVNELESEIGRKIPLHR